MAQDNEVTVNKVSSETVNSLLLQPQPTSPFPSPSSSFVPPPAQEPHEFANKATTRIAAAKQPRSATHSRRNSSEDRRLSLSPLQVSNSQSLAPDQQLPPTPSLKRFSAESNNSLSSSRPAPVSPALSRHSSLLHTGSAKRLSTLSIVSNSTPPPIIGAVQRRLSIKIRDFAFAPADERHFGRCSQNRDSVVSSTGSEVFSGSRGPASPSSPSSGYQSGGDDFTPGIYRAMYPFEPEGTAEMALVEDQRIHVLGRGGGVGWVVVLKSDGEHALVPEGYLELVRADLDDDDDSDGDHDDDESIGATETPQTPKAFS
ncbi:hypothetical protein RSOLAG1IB_10295 [Rhizoctonia solani AG-1 IB]|uniref:SH3 domain-containing protein n=1 Tax=Thanatephorus cucumeris (strain AG1-IB / isolate 7/3/14) TaxID=1108050 RepID=A0A0B7FW92_THACB|nr:hypothetical protein RSOLAG1IB_10295 [Rhizoctonia solani AG-1 IB]